MMHVRAMTGHLADILQKHYRYPWLGQFTAVHDAGRLLYDQYSRFLLRAI